MEQSATQSLDRALTLLAAVCADDGATPVSALAERAGVPASTARRLLAVLENHGLVARAGHGRRVVGAGLMRLADHHDLHSQLVALARPALRRLAGVGTTAHLGVLDGDMVNYLVKEGAASLFTREGG